MILLNVDNLRKHYGPEPILDGLSLVVRPGEKIAMVGPNGAGKTTLLRILAEEEEADGGTVTRHASVRIGYLRQRPDLDVGKTLWQTAYGALAALAALEHEAVDVAEAMAETDDPAEQASLAARYDHLQQELHHHDAYNLDHKVQRVLKGLGFDKDMFDRPVEALSGGELNRLFLAELLLADPELMLLDEPSNHLDLEATEWLEDYLMNTSASVLLVSHDRYFLDKVSTRTVELLHGTIDSFSGNFSAYLRQKEDRLLVQRRTYEKQRIEIAKTRDFIRRHSYGQKHAQAEDRRKKLERIVPVPRPREIELPPMAFANVDRSGDVVLRAEHLTKAYDEPLFTDLSLDVLRGQRWAVMGPNGSGKTTLLRCLIGQIEADAGQVHLGQGVRIGYFDQQLLAMDDTERAVDVVRPDVDDYPEPRRRNLLARFGMTGDLALAKVGTLSGGERCRVALARLAAAEANVLVLDEPTNHLDLWAREALQEALTAFDGTILFVSHDRYLIDHLADHLIVVEPGRFRVIEGDYTAYRSLVASGLAGSDGPGTISIRRPTPRPVVNVTPKTSAQPKRRFPFRKVEHLEQDIARQESALETLNAELVDPQTHRNGDRVRQVKLDIEQAREKLASLYEHWEEAVELNW